MKTKIPSLSYNAMFKAVFANNKYLLAKLVEAILDYYKLDIDITGKELIIKRNELNVDNYQDKQLICDYIIKIDDDHEINIEINKSKYTGLSERNLTYSFKIYYDHFKVGDSYLEFNKYTFFQVNFNNFANSNGKSINKYYMIDIDDLGNKLSNNFSVMNIDIAKCFKLVYNNTNLEGISNLEIWGAILKCDYLEDITSILERRQTFMDKETASNFADAILKASMDKNVEEDLRLEKTWQERWDWIEGIAMEEKEKEVTEKVTKEVTKEVTTKIVKSLLTKKISYEDISEITGMTIDEIEKIARKNA